MEMEMKEETKVDKEVANRNLKLAEDLAEYYDEEEMDLVEHNARLAKCNLELAVYHDDDLDMELAESNGARVTKCNLKLAERLASMRRRKRKVTTQFLELL